MKNRYTLFFALLAGTVLVLFANVFVQNRMDVIVKEDKLVDESFAAEGTPPIVAFSTMALGGFRGIIADILWLRAGELQQKGKYYELVQLSDWILKLQPKFSGAASYMGWNMAYNVSVACKRPEDRWRWVRRGIQLMQEAVTMNPNDPAVYQELGWIYQHKLGNVLDDAQRYYKETMARDLMFLYGKHYPDWEAWAAAPATEEAFRERFPADHPAWLAIMEYNQGDLERLFGEFRLNGGLPKELKEKLKPEDVSVLDCYFRRKWLKTDWNVDPETILAVNKTYGELDWLLPESFAIYWAYVGLGHTEGDREQLPLTRMILQSLVATFNYGRMLLPKENEVSSFFLLVPNTGVIDATRKLYKEIMSSDEYAHSPFEALYENFLIDSIVTLYTYSQKEAASNLYQELRTDIKNANSLAMTLDQFVLNEWEDDIQSGDFKQIGNELEGLIFTSCILIGYGDREAAADHLALARRVYDSYARQHEDLDRVALPPFSEMKARTARAIIENYPPEIANRVRAELEEDLQKQESTATDAGGSGADQEAAGQ
jgi:hypothetical protein